MTKLTTVLFYLYTFYTCYSSTHRRRPGYILLTSKQMNENLCAYISFAASLFYSIVAAKTVARLDRQSLPALK